MKRSVLLSAALVVAALSSCSSSKKTAEPGVPGEVTGAMPGELDAKVQALVDEYRKHGHSMTARLSIRKTDRSGANDYFDAQQDILFPPSYYESKIAFLGALGSPVPRWPWLLRKTAVQMVADKVTAYYDWSKRELVLTSSEMSVFADQEALLAHEIGHAIQDERQSFDELLRVLPSTVEGRGIFQAVTEGEAEALAADLLLRRQNKTLVDVDVEDFSTGLERLMAGPMGGAYEVGRRMAMRRYREGQWPAVHELGKTPPASTEQILHAEKWRTDEPTTVEIPEDLIATSDNAALLYSPHSKRVDGEAAAVFTPPGELFHQDVVGEMGIFQTLTALGVPEADAYLASTGWDGDRLHCYRHADGSYGIVWRTIWDRPADAQQFATVLGRIAAAKVHAPEGGREVVVMSGELEHDPSVLASMTTPPASVEDAQSTAAAEAGWLAARQNGPRIEGDRFVDPKIGLSMPVPQGWALREVSGMMTVSAEPVNGFADNLLVMQAPNLQGQTLATMAAEIEKFAKQAGVEVLENALTEIDGKQGVLYHYKGILPGNANPLHILGFTYFEGHLVVSVAATIGDARWQEREALARAALSGIRFLKK